MINKSMNKFLKNRYRFVNFNHIATWDEMLNVVIATLIFLTTIRLMRVLNYNTRVTQLASVLSHKTGAIKNKSSILFLPMIAFVMVVRWVGSYT
jgi:hypothetical protein